MLTRVTGSLHKDQCTFIIKFRSVLPRMRSVSNLTVHRDVHRNIFIY